MEKIVIQWDLDGVLVKYPEGVETPENFLNLPPIEESVEVYRKLCEDPRFECYILSTAPWDTPEAWTEKRLWVEKHLGESSVRRLTLTHNKQLVMGHYLIDDRPNNGASEFKGEWIQYKEGETSWESILKIIGY